jgi:hypothetical protein
MAIRWNPECFVRRHLSFASSRILIAWLSWFDTCLHILPTSILWSSVILTLPFLCFILLFYSSVQYFSKGPNTTEPGMKELEDCVVDVSDYIRAIKITAKAILEWGK